MTLMLDDTKRSSIAIRLADMQAIQGLILYSEQKLLSECNDEEICQCLQATLQADQKNADLLGTVIVQYGIKAKPDEITQEFVEQAHKMMESNKPSLYDKASQHELLKHIQFRNGIVIQKAAQELGGDGEAATTPLTTINYESQAHQEQLIGLLEILGTHELTKENAAQGS